MSLNRRVEAGRRLISPSMMLETGMTEYFDADRGSRFIHIPEESPIIDAHLDLAAAGLAVFTTALAREGGIELVVPSGSMSIRKALKSIAHDLQGYTETFHQLGHVIRQAEAVGVGGLGELPKRSLLSSVAITPDEYSDYGSSVRFVPPYSFNPHMTLIDDLLIARKEMLGTKHFADESSVIDMLAEVALGYDSDAQV